MKICFLIGSVGISGGAYVIFQHASYLNNAGHEVTIGAQDPFDVKTYAWHPLAFTLNIIPLEKAEKETFDLVIATWWKTALDLHRFNSHRYAYFVQSIESRFYSESEVPLRKLVDSTYDLPISFVTEANWIRQYLHQNHGKNAYIVQNGIRKDLYTPKGPRISPPLKKGRLRILVEGPFGVFFKNTGRAINIVKRAQPDEIWLLTNSDVGWMTGVDRVFSCIPVTKVPEIYRSCDVIVKLSYVEGMFGPPLEMFHCGGTAITYDVTGHDEYILHGQNALVAKRDDERQVVEYLKDLRNKPELLHRLKKGAKEAASNWPDWNHSSALFCSRTNKILEESSKTTKTELKSLADAVWRSYTNSEKLRIRRSPWISIRNKLHAKLDKLHPEVSRRLRWLRYLSECYK
jgi:O-antigen biosynthesis protein